MIIVIVVIHVLSFLEMEKPGTRVSGFSGFLVIREEA
jgi:hypothetical protein